MKTWSLCLPASSPPHSCRNPAEIKNFFYSTRKNQVHNQLDKAKPSRKEENIRPGCVRSSGWKLASPAQLRAGSAVCAEGAGSLQAASNEPHRTNKQEKSCSQISTKDKRWMILFSYSGYFPTASVGGGNLS